MVQFSLRPQQQFRGSIRVLTGLFIAFQVVNVSLLLTGQFSVLTSTGFAIMLAFTLPAIFWGAYRQGQGVARVGPEGLSIVTRGGERSYSWDHVSSIRLTSPAQEHRLQQLWTRLVGQNLNDPFVELKLRRLVRESPFTLFRSRHGTDVLGIPIPGTRMVRLYVEHPEQLLRMAESFLTSASRDGEIRSTD